MLLRAVECWLVAVNLLAFGLCGLDKWKARRGFWRVRERTLLGTARGGGAPGRFAGVGRVWRGNSVTNPLGRRIE